MSDEILGRPETDTCRGNTNDGDELTDLIDSHESLLAYALDNRLE